MAALEHPSLFARTKCKATLLFILLLLLYNSARIPSRGYRNLWLWLWADPLPSTVPWRCRLLYVGVGKKWARWRQNGKSITMDRGTSTMCDVNLSENPQNGSRARANRMYCAQGMYSGGCWRREQENLRPPSIGIMSGTYRPCWLNCNVATSSAAELAPAQIFH